MVVYRLSERSRDSGPFLSVPKPGRRKSGCCFGAHGQMAWAGLGVMGFILAAAAFVIGVPTDQNVDRIIAGDNITISPENGYGVVTINSTGANGNGAASDNNVEQIIAGTSITISPENGYGVVTINSTADTGENNVTRIIAGENVGISPENGYGDVTITAAGYDNTHNVQRIIAGENIIISPADGYGDVTISAIGGAWTLIADLTLTGNVTNVTFSGLDLEGDGPYQIFMLTITATALNNDIRLFFNGDTTTTHYYVQQFQVNNTTIAASRLNEAWISYGDGIAVPGFSVLFMGKIPGGITRTFSLMARPLAAASCQIANLLHVWASSANVTSMTFAGRSANCIGTGSRFIIYGADL